MAPIAELLESTDETTSEAPTPWKDIVTRLSDRQENSYWLATVRPDGRPHQRPIWAEWVAENLYFSSGDTIKSKHLARDRRCSISIGTRWFDLVIEGDAYQVTDEADLHRVRDVYADKGWAPTVRDEAFHDILGAPTAGPPPYKVYRIEPVIAYVFPMEEWNSPTRWRF